MLFVKVSELKAGTIVPTVPSVSTMATGADLIVTTAQNKGSFPARLLTPCLLYFVFKSHFHWEGDATKDPMFHVS